MGKINRENYIVINGWMLTDLELKGNELLIYACIYGFSQAENQVFNGSLQYLADWTNSTRRSVINTLQSLEEKGYITKAEKYISGVKYCEYSAIGGGEKFSTVVKNDAEGGEKFSLGGGEKFSPNNLLLDNTNNTLLKEINKEKSIRHRYGEYNNVLLSDIEMEKLKEEFPRDYKDRIERLSEYMAYKGVSYKGHLATIRNWARREKSTQTKYCVATEEDDLPY